MDIGHNADLAIRKGRLITNCLDLSGGSFLQLAGVADSSIILSYDFYHRKKLLSSLKKGRISAASFATKAMTSPLRILRPPA
jgi:hypothetical protein